MDCELQNLNIECYYTNFYKLDAIVNGNSEKIDWKTFTSDYYSKFDEKFITKYASYIDKDSINMNSEYFQKNVDIFKKVGAFNLKDIRQIFDFNFLLRFKDVLQLDKLKHLYNIKENDYLENLELFDLMKVSTVVNSINFKYLTDDYINRNIDYFLVSLDNLEYYDTLEKFIKVKESYFYELYPKIYKRLYHLLDEDSVKKCSNNLINYYFISESMTIQNIIDFSGISFYERYKLLKHGLKLKRLFNPKPLEFNYVTKEQTNKARVF